MQRANKSRVIRSSLLAALGLLIFQLIAGAGTTVQASGPEACHDERVTWGPAYDDDETLVERGVSRAAPDYMRQVDRQALTGQRWGPAYDAEHAIVAPGTKLTAFAGLVWGPAYSASDNRVEPGRHRDELILMKAIAPTTLTGHRSGPSYAAELTIAGARSRANAGSGIAWGPSYYSDDTIIEAGRSRSELTGMKQVDQNALRGVSEGPAYHP